MDVMSLLGSQGFTAYTDLLMSGWDGEQAAKQWRKDAAKGRATLQTLFRLRDKFCPEPPQA